MIVQFFEVTTETILVRKVGESLYRCRTCLREYNASMELCEGCYAADSQKHPGHEFARLMTQRVTDMPDDAEAQINNWWRCNFPGCNLGMFLSPIAVPRFPPDLSLTDPVTGPTLEWLHRHAEARLCMGDALIDSARETAGQLCLKTFSYRNRVPDSANPTNMTCKICLKGKPLVPLFNIHKTSLKDTDASALTPQSQPTVSGTNGVTPATSWPAMYASIPAVARTAIACCGCAL